MTETGKPTADEIRLSTNLSDTERSSLVTYALGAIDRDTPLRRRVGEAKYDDFRKFAASLITNGSLDRSEVRQRGIDPDILARKARSIVTSFMIRISRT